MEISDDKIFERIVLLKRYLYHIEWDHPNDVKSAVVKYLYKDASLAPNKLNIEELSKLLSDEQIKDLMKFSPVIQYRSFRGRYYTAKNGSLQLESS